MNRYKSNVHTEENTDNNRRMLYGPPDYILNGLNPTNESPFTSYRLVCYNTNVGTTAEDLNETDGNFDWTTEGSQLSFVSTSAADALGSSGINSLLLQGLDQNWDIINEQINLNGLTPVVTTNTFLRLNGVLTTAGGSNVNAVGNITATGDGFTWWKVRAGSSYVNNLGRFSVARNHSLVVENFGWTSPQGGDFEILAFFQTPGLARQEIGRFYAHAQSHQISGSPNKLTEMTDIYYRTKRETGGGGSVKISLYLTGYLSNNTTISEYYV